MTETAHANVEVIVRVKPTADTGRLISVAGNVVTLDPPVVKIESRAQRHRSQQSFAFDHCFDDVHCDTLEAQNAQQEAVFNKVGIESLDSIIDGYNSCILAYGQTGSGKTWTMTGTAECPGLAPRLCESLFERLNSDSSVVTSVRVSFCEIYNEKIRDLLAETATNLRVLQSAKLGVLVDGLRETVVQSSEQAISLLQQGLRKRATAATLSNVHSSRSHAIFTVHVRQVTEIRPDKTKPDEIICEEKSAHLRLVDLAGSERSSVAGTQGDRLREGANINKSLVSLGQVMSALSERSSGPGRRVIPYRDSVLTRLLKDSLGGNSRTSMVACIAPEHRFYEQSLSTLRYACTAKKIELHATANRDLVSAADADARIAAMQTEIEDLQQALAQKLGPRTGDQAAVSDEVSARIRAAIRFYEDRADTFEARHRAAMVKMAALERHNALLTGCLQELKSNIVVSGKRLHETKTLEEDIQNGLESAAVQTKKWRRYLESVE